MSKIHEPLEELRTYLKDRKDFARDEEEHVTACRGLVALGDLQKHLRALPPKELT